MAPEQSQLPVVDLSTKSRCCNLSYAAMGLAAGVVLTFLIGVAFYAGRQSKLLDQATWNGIPTHRLPPELLSASGSHGSVNMAVCTAQVDENVEGFFALDYLTGNLMGWVYYPRQQQFGGQFMTNVMNQLGPTSKNPEYLLVSGGAAPTSMGGNVRPAASLIYVVDMRSGYFGAYTIPWSRTSENSAMPQGGPILFVGGGQIREPWGLGNKKPAAPPPAGANAFGPGAPAGNNPAAPGGAVKKDPNNPDANVDPAQPGAVPPLQPGNNNNNKNNKGKK